MDLLPPEGGGADDEATDEFDAGTNADSFDARAAFRRAFHAQAFNKFVTDLATGERQRRDTKRAAVSIEDTTNNHHGIWFVVQARKSLLTLQQGKMTALKRATRVFALVDLNGRKTQMGVKHDGNLDMYTDNALVTREKLRRQPEIVDMITRFWNVLDLVRSTIVYYSCLFRSIEQVKSPTGGIRKKEYIVMIVKFMKLMQPACHPKLMKEEAENDWKKDSKGKDEMDEQMFFDCVFEIADQWVSFLYLGCHARISYNSSLIDQTGRFYRCR